MLNALNGVTNMIMASSMAMVLNMILAMLYMILAMPVGVQKTRGNKSVKHKDEKETTTNNTNTTTNEKDASYKSDTVDDVYNIESLVEKKGSIYLVKWENYPEDQNTWESKCSIPDCVREVNNSFLNFVFFLLF